MIITASTTRQRQLCETESQLLDGKNSLDNIATISRG